LERIGAGLFQEFIARKRCKSSHVAVSVQHVRSIRKQRMSDHKPGHNRILVIVGNTANLIGELHIVSLGPSGVLGCLDEISDSVPPRKRELLEPGVRIRCGVPRIGSREINRVGIFCVEGPATFGSSFLLTVILLPAEWRQEILRSESRLEKEGVAASFFQTFLVSKQKPGTQYRIEGGREVRILKSASQRMLARPP
jgi:hypothetical protein